MDEQLPQQSQQRVDEGEGLQKKKEKEEGNERVQKQYENSEMVQESQGEEPMEPNSQEEKYASQPNASLHPTMQEKLIELSKKVKGSEKKGAQEKKSGIQNSQSNICIQNYDEHENAQRLSLPHPILPNDTSQLQHYSEPLESNTILGRGKEETMALVSKKVDDIMKMVPTKYKQSTIEYLHFLLSND